MIEMWLKGKAPSTVENYLFELRGFFEWFESYAPAAGLGRPGLENLTTDIFSLYIHEILMYRSKSKRARARFALGSLFRFLAKTGTIKKNPFDLIPSIKVESRVFDRYLSREQVLKMISLESHPRNRLILKCLYQGAFRVSELVGIRFSDLSYAERDQMMFVAVIGKGSKPRTVGLYGSVVHDLRAHRLANESMSEFVFFSREEGHPHINKTRVNEIVSRAAWRAGIAKKVSPHWLRHAHASHAIEKGAPLHLVRDTLGHSSAQTTGIYLDVNPEESSSDYLLDL